MKLRQLDPEQDSLAELTDLLNRAYAPLAGAGMRYLASHQDVETTRQRLERGECWVGEVARRVVATVTIYPPRGTDSDERTPEWYRRADVVTFGQMAVEPELQGRGLGSRLLDLVERRARELSASEVACDTSEHAAHLIEMYSRRGYRLVAHADWRPVTNYRSVVLSKSLAA